MELQFIRMGITWRGVGLRIRNQDFRFWHTKFEMLLIIQVDILCIRDKSSGERMGLGVMKVYMEFIDLSSPRNEYR